MDTTATRYRRPRDRKQQLATVASQLFGVRGYHGVGVTDIATAAGVSGPAVYRHFTDKQAILAHVLLSGIDELEAVTAQALSGSKSPAPARLDALLAMLATKAVERREVAAVWRWEGRHLALDDQREIRRRSAAVLAAWARVLRDVRANLSGPDAQLLCWAGLSVFGSVSVHHTTLAKQQFGDLLAQLAHRVLNAPLPQPGADRRNDSPTSRFVRPTRREQLLTAATTLFHRHGFHAVSMEDIGSATGIAGPSVYRHFPSKASLLTAICHRAAERLTFAAEHALHTSAPPDEREALRRLTRSYAHAITASPELAVTFANAHIHADERDRAELTRIQRDYVAQWVHLLAAIHPQLSTREAKITVHVALTIANDLTRTRRINTHPHLATELVTLMTAALDIT